MSDVDQSVELAARESYGRLLAWLTSKCGSIAMAEDALADALAAAVRTWPRDGVPDKPEAWLLTVGRRRLIDEQRRLDRQTVAEERLAVDQSLRLNLAATEANDTALNPGVAERRLELMFLCTREEVPANMRTPLMLQTVLGLTAEQIASVMLVAPATIGQRLVRVKRRLAETSVPFELPPDHELPERVGPVLDAIYAAYGTGWNDAGGDGSTTGLAAEAIWLAGLVVRLLPEIAEAKGLYALLCLSESRRGARRSSSGAFVPLHEQCTDDWDDELIESGELALWHAAQLGPAGRYQTEAAIQSLHANRRRTGVCDWSAIRRVYEVLAVQYPTTGALIGYAAALGHDNASAAGLAVLDRLDDAMATRHQPYWAVRASLLVQLDDVDGARLAFDRAIGLTVDEAVRDWLIARRSEV